MIAMVWGWMLVMSATAEPPMIAEIRLADEPAKYLSGQANAGQPKVLQMSAANARKFKIVPGLAFHDFVSLEAVGFSDFYVRHSRFVFYLWRRPRLVNPGFDHDTTFKMIRLEGDKVRFEATNYPDYFMTAQGDEAVVLLKDPPLDRSTFVLKKE